MGGSEAEGDNGVIGKVLGEDEVVHVGGEGKEGQWSGGQSFLCRGGRGGGGGCEVVGR
jgi:hypothetical protein